MNRIYRLVWNRAQRMLQVASELTTHSNGEISRRAFDAKRLMPTVLSVGISIALLSIATPVCADTGTASGGAGATGGSVGSTPIPAAGAGGSAGVNGPTAGSGYQPGAAGTSSSLNGGNAGQNGQNPTIGAGGGGGGANDGTAFSNSAQTGGSGGMGGWNGYSGGGGGGAGGLGVVLTGASGVLTSSGTITGGAGGNGGVTSGYAPRGGGGGGGGGGGLYMTTNITDTSVTINANITGGAGGTGGASGGGGGTNSSGAGGSSSGASGAGTSGTSGGGGGGGGGGVSFDSTASGQTSLVNNSTITGGAGGNGGEEAGSNGNGGNAGSGGAGVSLGGSQIVLTNTGNIVGGAGGAAGICTLYCGGTVGTAGNGGIGIVVSGGNNTIINSGSISGGLSGDGSTRAAAIDLSGGGNTLVLEANSNITGNVVSSSGSTNGGDTLALGGDTNANGGNSFNTSQIGAVGSGVQYQGFTNYSKIGASTWTLTGSTNALTPWVITGGTLALSSDAALGNDSGTVTLNGGILEDTASLALLHSLVIGSAGGTLQIDAGNTLFAISGISGTGNLTQTGTGTLELSGVVNTTDSQTYNGTLAPAGALTLSASTITLNAVSGQGSALTLIAANASLNGNMTDLLQFTDYALTQTTHPISITTTGGGQTYGPLQLGGNATLSDSGAGNIELTGGANGSGYDLNVQTGGQITFDSLVDVLGLNAHGGTFSAGALTIGNDLSITTTAGAISQSGAYSVLGDSTFNAGSNNITLTNTDNAFTGAVSLSGNNASLTNSVATVLGTSQIAGALTVSGAGTLSQNGSISAASLGGSASGDTALTNAGNAIATLGNFNASGNFSLNDATALTVSGTLSANNVILDDTAAATVTGTITAGSITNAQGTLQVGNGGTAGSLDGNVVNQGSLVFDRSDVITFGNTITGAGSLTQNGSGTLILDGINTYTGNTTVQAGTLEIGDASHASASISSNVSVASGASLSGHGTIIGNVALASGSQLAPGGSIGTLTVDDNLTAAQGSLMDFAFGAPGANFQTAGSGDSVAVGGNLTLDGATLNVTDAGGMGPGLYNVFTYGGTLTEASGGLTLGTTPTGQTVFLQSLTAQKQINLIDTTGYTLDAWNANGHASATQMGGGNGTWSATSQVWTDATATVPNGPMSPAPGFALFGGSPGTVTVDDSAGTVQATGMQFAVDGYTLAGASPTDDTLTLVASGNGTAPVINVGDGSSASTSITATISAVIAGSAGLTKTDYGTLVLTGSNTYTGGTFLDGGTLSVASDANLGDATGAVTLDGGTLENTAAFTTARAIELAGNGTLQTEAELTVSGVISGSGALTKGGAGALTLTDANTYTGATTVNAGTLALSGNGSVADSSDIDIASGATFDVSGTTSGASITSLDGSGAVNIGSQTLTLTNASGSFAGAIGGTGGLTLAGGTETLSGANTYSGTTMIGTGTLALSGSGNIAASSDVVANGMFDISGTTSGASIASLDGSGAVHLGSQTLTLTNASGSFGGAIGGSGGLTLAGGTETLSGANTYTGTTTIGTGTLALTGAGSVAGSSGVNVASGATFDVSGTTAGTSITTLAGSGAVNLGSQTLTLTNASGGFAGVIAGNGGLTLAGGTLTLAGANTYSGGTTITSGTLVASTASLPGNVIDNAALVFDQSKDGTFSGAIAGTGSFAKSGSGTLILDGNGDAFAGSTTVQAGTLEVGDAATPSATLGGDVSVAAGATLRGHGSIGGNVTNGGIVWAGGSIGTLTIQGNYTQTAQGVLDVEATPAGQASLLAVNGTASLAGSTLVLADTGNWAPRTDYTILTAAGGVNGQFASASVNLAFLNPVLSYAGNTVTLSLERNDINFSSVAQTPNQRAVAAAANPLGFDNPVYDVLVVLDAPTARHAFDQLSGEIHASTRTAIADDDHYVRDAINQHLAGQSNDVNGLNITDADGVTAWTSTWGHWGSHDGDGNASTMDENGSGLLFGADMPVGGTTRLGAVMGTGEGTTRIDTLGSSAHTLDQHLGVYGSAQTGALLWQGAAIYGWQKVDTNRFIGFGSFDGTATSSYRAHTAQAYIDGSLPFALGHTTLAPFANLAVERLSTPNVQEGGTPAALDVASQSSTLGYGTLGLRATFDLGAPNSGLHAHASLGWQHAWGDVLPVDTMRFASGGDDFDIAGTPVLRNAGVANLGISFTIAPNVSVDGTYQGQFGKQANDQSGRISLDWKF